MDRLAIAYGGVTVCRGGVAADHDEAAVAAHMAGATGRHPLRPGPGRRHGVVMGVDLGYGYIDENRTTS